MQVGDVMPTKRSGDVVILVIAGQDVTVRFLRTGNERVTAKSSLKKGSVLDKDALPERRVRPKDRLPPDGFVVVPGQTDYFVSREGEVWSRRLGKCMKSRPNSDGYMRLRVGGQDSGSDTSIRIGPTTVLPILSGSQPQRGMQSLYCNPAAGM